VAEQLSECLGALIQGVVWRHNLAKYLLCILYKQSELTSEALDCVSNPIRLNTDTMLFNELFNSTPEPLDEGVLDNSGQEHSPVASAIIRRILLQRTDLLSKYGPEKVGAAVDDVADFVGDEDEIGSSDVSGWVRQVEQMLGNMTEAGYKRDAYQRDYDNSVAGMGKRDSYAYSQDGGGNDERHDLDPTEWYIVKDGKMFKATVYPNQVQSAMSQGFSPSREEAKAKAGNQGVAEGDISQIEKDIAAAPVEPIANMEGSDQKIGNMDADAFDAAMARLKKLAGAGPMKTVWDPARRQYRNMPTAQQPSQQPKK
jgi:hypothetical protein